MTARFAADGAAFSAETLRIIKFWLFKSWMNVKSYW